MPELPEMEAWRRQLNDPVSAFPVAKAGPAHIATLKTFDPPLSALAGRRFRGVERRGKRLFFPTDDGELVLLVHLMTAGRLKMLRAGEDGPKTPAFRLEFAGGSKLILTENARKKRAGVWLLTPEAARVEVAHPGPRAVSSCASATRATSGRTACTTGSASPATSAARRSRAWTSRSTRSTTAPTVRPAAASSRTGVSRVSCADAPSRLR